VADYFLNTAVTNPVVMFLAFSGVILLLLARLEGGRRTATGSRLAVVALVAALAWWYVDEYDSATGRCYRGDFGACIVAQSLRESDPSR
jgi:hypothetical protein